MNGKLIDITGKKYGKLTVLSRSENKGKAVMWNCLCECGNTNNVQGGNLKNGSVKSCGCVTKLVDMTGKKYGRLTVISRAENKGIHTMWNCMCECGNKGVYNASNLRTNHTKSCGCLILESLTSHGCSKKNIYKIWQAMKERCKNPKHNAYHHYGARGITVCDRWLKFENFYADMGDRPEGLTLDRINNNKGYCKENCRWTTWSQQGLNQRTRTVNTSGMRGVEATKNGRWTARIRVEGKNIQLGTYVKFKDACKARRDFEIEHNIPYYDELPK